MMCIIGIDLAGPSNHKDTALAHINNKRIRVYDSLSDSDIVSIITSNSPSAIGLDAPLSYSETGGYRNSDRALRTVLNERDFPKIGVMAPTFNRMIYLTTRGIRLTRLISHAGSYEIYETHPGAYLVLDGLSYNEVRSVKECESSIAYLVSEIEKRGYRFESDIVSDHHIMAVGVALCVESKMCNEHHWEYSPEAVDEYPFIA